MLTTSNNRAVPSSSSSLVGTTTTTTTTNKKKLQHHLPQSVYVRDVAEIIARDFFPELSTVKTIEEEEDDGIIRKRRQQSSKKKQRPRTTRELPSLNEYLSTHAGEDDARFDAIRKKEKERTQHRNRTLRLKNTNSVALVPLAPDSIVASSSSSLSSSAPSDSRFYSSDFTRYENTRFSSPKSPNFDEYVSIKRNPAKRLLEAALKKTRDEKKRRKLDDDDD